MSRLLFALFVLPCASCASHIERPDLRVPKTLPRIEVTTTIGTYRGVQEPGTEPVLAFYGIPYAGPVEGLGRFLPPEDPKPFEEILDATDYGPACAQVEAVLPDWLISEKAERYMAYAGIADIAAQEKGPGCLNLNLWTSSLTPDEPGPVMVFLHGGGLNQGSNRSAYVHGAKLARKGVVVVNLNFRLGNQGFLAGGGGFDGDVLIPNRGILDVLAGLRWVRDHVASFGGDPSRVTVVGESGGAFATWALLSSPSADGLLHRAILHSAPPVMTPVEDLHTVSRELLDDLEVAPGDTTALAAVADDDIPHTALSQKLFSGDEKYGFLGRNNLPFNGAHGTKLIPEDTIPSMRSGRNSQIDIMIGCNKHEARGLSILVPLPDLLSTQITGGFLAGLISDEDGGHDRIREAYQELLPDASELDVEEAIIQDAVFRQPKIRAAEARSRHGGTGRTYLFEFHWESPCCDDEVGAIHALEMAFAYNNLESARMLTLDDPTAAPLAEAMSDAWVSFAKTGVPTSPSLPEWPVYDEETRRTMVFDRVSRVVEDLEKERRLFWNEEYAR